MFPIRTTPQSHLHWDEVPSFKEEVDHTLQPKRAIPDCWDDEPCHEVEASALQTPKARLQAHLQAWCDEQTGTSEYENRLTAKQRIEVSFDQPWAHLDLSSLRLTSLPKLEEFSFSSVTVFDCSNNNLKILPDFSSTMPHLESLVCSNNQIEVLPHFKFVMPALQWFNCSNNELKTIYDFSPITPCLTTFDCSHNPIETLPIFTCIMPALQEFNCSNNQLRILPDFSSTMPHLENLVCSNNQIETLPHFKFVMSVLQWFNCSNNELKTLDDFSSQIPALKEFDCSHNLIETLPIFTCIMSALQEFNCSNNQLKTIDDFSSQMPHLQEFDCSNNQLEIFPVFTGIMLNLKKFDCSYNHLETLSKVLLRWPRMCEIHAEFNCFSSYFCTNLHGLLTKTRKSSPVIGPQVYFSIRDAAAARMVVGTLLAQTITFWLKEFKMAFPKTSHEALWSTLDEREFPNSTASKSMTLGAAASSIAVDSFLFVYQTLLEHEQEGQLNQFLNKLTETADYKNAASRNNVIFKVQRFLSSAIRNKTFKDHMFLLIDEALSSCSDTVFLSFNKIELSWKLKYESVNPTQLGLAKLLIGVKRIELLDDQSTGIVIEHKLGDALETFLYCQVKLKKALTLPLSIEGVFCPTMSGITPAMLELAKKTVLAQTTSKEAIFMLLCESDYWIELLKKNHKTHFNKIVTEYSDKMTALNPDMLGASYKDDFDQIHQEQQGCQQSLVLSLTENWLEKHYRKLIL